MPAWTSTDTHIKRSISGESYRADIIILIPPRSESNTITILVADNPVPALIKVSVEDVKRMNNRLRDAFKRMVRIRRASSGDTSTDPEMSDAVRELATAGRIAYTEIFDHDTRREIESLTVAGQVKIQIVQNEEFSFPWEMFYTGDLDAEISFEHFWGTSHIITRTLTQLKFAAPQPPGRGSAEIAFSPRPRVGLLTDTDVISVAAKEIPFFKGLKDDGKIALVELGALDPLKKLEGFKELQGFWNQSLHLAQMACDAYTDLDNLKPPYLNLSDKFRIQLNDMKGYRVAINNRPLVILNACGTGFMDPLSTSNFVKEFLELGALGVIATECILPDSFAAAFVEQFYNRLLNATDSGECFVGECLLDTRRHFLEQHGDPTGLLYSMYAPLSTRLKKHSQRD